MRIDFVHKKFFYSAIDHQRIKKKNKIKAASMYRRVSKSLRDVLCIYNNNNTYHVRTDVQVMQYIEKGKGGETHLP